MDELKTVCDLHSTVRWFNGKTGIGFLVGPEGQDIFCHFSFIVMEGFKTLAKNQEVVYDLVETPRGLQAHNIRPI